MHCLESVLSNNPKKFLRLLKKNYFYHWNKKKDTEKYKSFYKIYIANATKIINSRTNKMVDELIELLL